MKNFRAARKNQILPLIVPDGFYGCDPCYELRGNKKHKDDGCHCPNIEKDNMGQFEVYRNASEVVGTSIKLYQFGLLLEQCKSYTDKISPHQAFAYQPGSLVEKDIPYYPVT